jgi:CDP-glucose 4,6-dehydratase
MMRDPLCDLYTAKTVLVTGHTGFKGSWLSIWLMQLGAKVIGYALPPRTLNDNFVLSGLKHRLADIRGDIRDARKLQNVLEQYRPEFVFHLAAQPLVRRSYENPAETFEINFTGTLNLLECIKKSDHVRAAVIVTSDKCYENREQLWGYRETDPLGGQDPYSASKGCAEILVAAYRSSFMNPCDYRTHEKSIASARAGNAIGGGDWSPGRLVPDCIRSFMNGQAAELRNPGSIRPWQHVLEPLYGYLLLAGRLYEDGPGYGEAWNFGPDRASAVPVKAVAEKLIREWGEGSWTDLSDRASPHEAGLLNLDSTKAFFRLGWKPRLTLEDAIRYTVEWYKNCHKKDCYNMCVEQINGYMQLCCDS